MTRRERDTQVYALIATHGADRFDWPTFMLWCRFRASEGKLGPNDAPALYCTWYATHTAHRMPGVPYARGDKSCDGYAPRFNPRQEDKLRRTIMSSCPMPIIERDHNETQEIDNAGTVPSDRQLPA